MKLPDHTIAALLYLLLACSPGGIWFIFLFVGESGSLTRIEILEYVLSPENPGRWFFILLAGSLLFSVAAGALLFAKNPSKAKLGVVFVGGVAQCLAYLLSSVWVLAAISAMPLYWVGREYKKV